MARGEVEEGGGVAAAPRAAGLPLRPSPRSCSTFLDTTIVSVALADVQANLHARVSALQWVVNGYALTFASLWNGHVG